MRSLLKTSDGMFAKVYFSTRSLSSDLNPWFSRIFRRKLAAKLAETEEELAAALSKANAAEKAKQRLAGEVEDLNVELDKVCQ